MNKNELEEMKKLIKKMSFIMWLTMTVCQSGIYFLVKLLG